MLDQFGVENVVKTHRRDGSVREWLVPKGRAPGWRDPDLRMPGEKDPPPSCGNPYTAMCSSDWTHPKKRGIHQCATRNCRQCAKVHTPDPMKEPEPAPVALLKELETLAGKELFDEHEIPKYPTVGAWINKAVRSVGARLDYTMRLDRMRPMPHGNGRLDVEGHKMDLRTTRMYHATISPEDGARPWGFTRKEEAERRRQARKIAVERGISNFVLWCHSFRHDGTEETDPNAYTRFGLHYHILGVSRWAMLAPPKKAVRGRPPATSPQRTLHAFDGKAWGPIKTRREPMTGWVWKVVWFAQNQGHDLFIVRHLEREKTYRKTTNGFVGYVRRVVQYLFHHATFYDQHRHPTDDPYDKKKVKWVRTPGRHATPSCMAYGATRMPRPKDDDTSADAEVYRLTVKAWKNPAPCCEQCGSPMVEVFDDPECPAALLMQRIQDARAAKMVAN